MARAQTVTAHSFAPSLSPSLSLSKYFALQVSLTATVNGALVRHRHSPVRARKTTINKANRRRRVCCGSTSRGPACKLHVWHADKRPTANKGGNSPYFTVSRRENISKMKGGEGNCAPRTASHATPPFIFVRIPVAVCPAQPLPRPAGLQTSTSQKDPRTDSHFTLLNGLPNDIYHLFVRFGIFFFFTSSWRKVIFGGWGHDR